MPFCVRMATRTRIVVILLWLVCALGALCRAATDFHGDQVPFKISLASGSVSASAECGKDQSGKVVPTTFNCRENNLCSRCGVANGTNYSAGFAADGNPATSWQSPPLSSGPYYNRTYLTVDLGWSYLLASINLAAGSSSLPHQIAVLYSSDGTSFNPSVYYVDVLSRCPSFTTAVQSNVAANEAAGAILCLAYSGDEINNISLSRGLQSVQARYVRLEFTNPRAAAGNESDPTQLYFSISELAIFVTCPQVLNTGNCYASDAVRHVVPSLQPDQMVRLLWQQDGFYFPGEWYLAGVGVVTETCSKQWTNSAACLQSLGTMDTCSSISASGGTCTMDAPCDVAGGNVSKVYFGGSGLRQALSSPLYIGVNQTAKFDVGIVSYPPQCASKISPIEVRACPALHGTQIFENCSLVSIISAGECGDCLDKLLLQLVNLTEVMNSSLLLLPNVYLNETNISSLYNRTMKLKDEVAILVAHVYIDGVVIGIFDTIPTDVELPPVVFRLDLNLTHSLFYLIAEANATLVSLDKLSLPAHLTNASTLVRMLDVGAVLKPASELLGQVNASLNDIISFVSAISANLTMTKMAVVEANLSLAVIQHRNFTSIAGLASSTLLEANETFIVNKGLYVEAERINKSVNLLLERVQSLAALLLQLRSVEVVVNGTLQNTTKINYSIKSLLVQIKALTLEALSLNESVHLGLMVVSSQLGLGTSLLNATLKTSQNASALLSSLIEHVKNLDNLVVVYDSELMGVVIKPCGASGDLAEQCTAGQLYARSLLQLYQYMNSSWIPTKTFAQGILAMFQNISQLLDFDTLNHIAQNALNESTTTLAKLSTVNTTAISFNASSVYDQSQAQSEQAVIARRNATVVEAAVNATVVFYSSLWSTYTDQAAVFRHIQDDSVALGNTPDYTQLANTLTLTNSVILSNLSNATGTLVSLEDGVKMAGTKVGLILDVVSNTTLNLNYTSFEFDLIGEFIDESRVLYNSLNFNISSILKETQMILEQIDSIVNDLGNIYNELNKINAPVVLSPTTVSPYVSLQPPPGTQLTNGSIQFQSLDLYLTSSPVYVTPALLFYAGPLTYGSHSDSLQEDYLFITAEANFLHLRWQLGSYSGDMQLAQSISGDAHISIARVGSLLQLQYSTGQLGPGVSSQLLLNNSILFHTTNSTIFLIGGKPDNAQLTPSFTIQGQASFYGQYQMIFFNGQPWGLWNTRGTSKTDLIGRKQFTRNQYVTPLLWHVTSSLQAASTLAFDGTGYLFVPVFFNDSTISNANSYTLKFNLRPSVVKKSLIAFMYNQKGTSFELGLLDDNNLMLIIKNSTSTFSQSISFANSLTIQFARSTSVLTINNNKVSSSFFQRLSDVKAWFGGINNNYATSSVTPNITNSYTGCLEASVSVGPSVYPVLLTDSAFFVNNYLNSPYQKGFSAACFTTIYTRMVGLNGSNYLQYTSVSLVSKPEEQPQPTFVGFGADTVVAISFTPVQSSGVLFVLTDPTTKNKLFAALSNGSLLVGVTNGVSNTPVYGRNKVTLGSTHYLLIRFNMSSNYLLFYLNGVLDGASSGFQIKPTSAPSSPMLLLGGASKGLVNALDGIPYYVGCLSDLTYGFRAVNLGTPANKTADISLSTCPYLAAVRAPSLDVEAPPPTDRQCLAQSPLQLGNSHGSFLASTQLLANGVLGLFARSWSLGLSLKYLSGGHVLSVQSLLGQRVTLLLVGGGQLVLEAYMGGVKMASRMYPKQITPLKFVNVVIFCSVDGVNLSCSLQLDGVLDPGGVVQVPYPRTVFLPLAPVVMGAAGNLSVTSTTGFSGCLRGLNINGDGSGFSQVKTVIPCFNNTETGYGFTGTSQIAWNLPKSSSSISVVFRPQLDNGLLLLLSSGPQPILAVGLYNGTLMAAANYSQGVLGTMVTSLTSQPLCSVGSPTLMDYTLNVTYSFINGQLGSITALVTSDPARVTTFLLTNVLTDNLTLTLGGAPAAVVVPAQSKWFSFLLSNNLNRDSLPPNFEGCIRTFYLNGAPLSLTNATVLSGVLVGLCPAAG